MRSEVKGQRLEVRGQRSNGGVAIVAAVWLLGGAAVCSVYALGYARGECAALESEVAK